MLTGPETPREIHLEITESHAERPAAALLSQAAGLSARETKDAMTKGAVWLSHGRHTRRLRRHGTRLRTGDRLHLYWNRAVLGEIPPKPTLIADEQSYSVWFKPFGMRSQGSKWGDHTTLGRWAEQHLVPERPAFTVHRLDRAASGVMLLAHGKAAAAQLAALFHNREVDKRYQAIVHGLLPEDRRAMTIDRPIGGKPAISHIRRLDSSTEPARTLLEIRIETGRKHQIRRHLAGADLPILGDRLYGRDGDPRDLALRAISLGFTCPVTGSERSYVLDPELWLHLDGMGT